MLRFFVRIWAKWSYVFRKEHEAALNEWSARVADRNAKDSSTLSVELKTEADHLEARIKHMADMEEKGFWTCTNGHESEQMPNVRPAKDHPANFCVVNVNGNECGGEVKVIRRSEMTGQEKYESDKDRREAEKLLAARRQEITDKETEAGQQDATAKYFRQQAASARALADSIRKI